MTDASARDRAMIHFMEFTKTEIDAANAAIRLGDRAMPPDGTRVTISPTPAFVDVELHEFVVSRVSLPHAVVIARSPTYSRTIVLSNRGMRTRVRYAVVQVPENAPKFKRWERAMPWTLGR